MSIPLSAYAPRIGLCVLLLSVITTARADETCGLRNVVYDSISKNGFDQSPNPSGDLGLPLDTAAVPTYGVTPTIAITDPQPGASTGSASIAVVGTYTGPAATGVNVNGFAAVVENGAFVIPRISLVNGSNTLQATVTTLDGLTATAQVAVTYSAAPSNSSLGVDTNTGAAPLSVGFNVAPPSNVSVQSLCSTMGTAHLRTRGRLGRFRATLTRPQASISPSRR